MTDAHVKPQSQQHIYPNHLLLAEAVFRAFDLHDLWDVDMGNGANRWDNSGSEGEGYTTWWIAYASGRSFHIPHLIMGES